MGVIGQSVWAAVADELFSKRQHPNFFESLEQKLAAHGAEFDPPGEPTNVELLEKNRLEMLDLLRTAGLARRNELAGRAGGRVLDGKIEQSQRVTPATTTRLTDDELEKMARANPLTKRADYLATEEAVAEEARRLRLLNQYPRNFPFKRVWDD